MVNLERELLMIPGPTMVSPRVLRALSQPVLSHGSKEFVERFAEALKLQRWLFMTEGTPLMLAGSGTLGMEAIIANVVEKGDRVLCLENGFFGEKWADIVIAHGGVPDRLRFDWGAGLNLKMISEKLDQGGYKAFTVEHVDTSTGIANPIDKIGELAKDSDALFIVDSVCGLGGMPFKMDEWNVDLGLTGSQKALGAPPGLTLFCLNEKAWKAIESRNSPVADYYADLKRWRPIMEDPRKYFATPATGMVLGMLEALRIIQEEGLENRWRRHEIFSKAFRAGLAGMGLKSFPEKGHEAHTLSVPVIPEGIKDSDVRGLMQLKYGVVVAGGLGSIAGKTIRIGHMGSATTNDVIATLSALEMAMTEFGYKTTLGSGVGAAEQILISHRTEG